MKRRPRYKVRIYDEAHLVDRGEFTLTWPRVVAAALVVMAIFIGIGIGIVWFTPLKGRLPGYLGPEQRMEAEDAILKVDSIRELYKVHQAYLDNLVKVLDTDRQPDEPDTVGQALPLIPDSLMVSSEIELEFMKKMQEAGYIIAITKEYNDSVDNEKE